MFTGCELSRANVPAPDADRALDLQSAIPNQAIQVGGTFMMNNLNASTTTVTMKYRSSALSEPVHRRFLMATALSTL